MDFEARLLGVLGRWASRSRRSLLAKLSTPTANVPELCAAALHHTTPHGRRMRVSSWSVLL